MPQYTINLLDLNLLLDIVQDSGIRIKLEHAKENGPCLAKRRFPTDRYLIDLSQAEVEHIGDGLTELLARAGLDKNYEPNDLGRRIENLLDIFNSYNN